MGGNNLFNTLMHICPPFATRHRKGKFFLSLSLSLSLCMEHFRHIFRSLLLPFKLFIMLSLRETVFVASPTLTPLSRNRERLRKNHFHIKSSKLVTSKLMQKPVILNNKPFADYFISLFASWFSIVNET